MAKYNYISHVRLQLCLRREQRSDKKGGVIIPKEIREKVGIREGSEVLISARNDDEVVNRKSSPPSESYVVYFITACSKKLNKRLDIRKLIEDEYIERSYVDSLGGS